MLDNLVLHNFPSGHTPVISSDSAFFMLSTCQRTLILSFEHINLTQEQQQSIIESKVGKEAYGYLLEIICGLKSKLLGENEIVGQFKTAYKQYMSIENKDSRLIAIIEKLFKDAKEIRSSYLTGLGQKTYSCIARKQIVSKHKACSVLIIGSGQLAEDLINQFKKKIDVFICARNSSAVRKLVKEHNIQSLPWEDFNKIKEFPFIANSIGFNGVLFNQDFFNEWAMKHNNKLFVDLGSPSSISTTLSYHQGVMKLEDVFKEGAIHENHKKQQVEMARKALDGIVEKRHRVFIQKIINHPNNRAEHAYV